MKMRPGLAQKTITNVILMLAGMWFAAACSTTNSRLPPSPTSTPSAALMASTPTPRVTLPAYTLTTLEIEREGNHYQVKLGIAAGEAFFRATPGPLLPPGPLVNSASIQWYGDFDHDGETEYLVAVWAPAAGCSENILAIDYDASQDAYRVFDSFGGDCTAIDRLDDLDKNGVPELVGKDLDYHYDACGGGMASVFSPIAILRYDGQKFARVTSQYPTLVEKDAEHWLEGIKTEAWGQGQDTSFLAAYLADMYTLNKKDQGETTFLRYCAEYPAVHMTCAELLQAVKAALVKNGYALGITAPTVPK